MYVLKNLTDVFIIYYLFVSGAEMVKKIESMNIDLSEPLNVCVVLFVMILFYLTKRLG